MSYDHFCLRLHDANRVNLANPASWELKTQEGALAAFRVGNIENPTPEPKTMSEDIPGSSGSLDTTDAVGRVFFENKVVTVTLSGQTDFDGMESVGQLFSRYQGRLVDFTFDSYLAVEWFQTGRMTAEIDRKLHCITMTIDTEPYRHSTATTYIRSMTVLDNYERDVNTAAWTSSSISGSILYSFDNGTNFGFSCDAPGARILRTKTVTPSSGFLALGVRRIVGGTVEFRNIDDDANEITYSKTIARVTNYGGTNHIDMRITVDGSYYEWHTVNGVERYLPTVKCSYVLSDFLPVDGNGELASAVTAELQTNIAIRPEFSNTGAAAVLIVDGVAVDFDSTNGTGLIMPRLLLPGDHADLSGATTKSIMVALPKLSGDTPVPLMAFYPAEVF